jgi:hypothetical protein
LQCDAAAGDVKRFVEGTDCGQSTLFPECLANWINENNPVQVIDVFVDELDLAELGFDGVAPEVAPIGGTSQHKHRLSHCPPSSGAGQSLLPRRIPFYARLDRSATARRL